MPWVTIILTALLALNPVGLAFIAQSFSSEALSANIAAPFVLMGATGLLIVLAVELAIRRKRSLRRQS